MAIVDRIRQCEHCGDAFTYRQKRQRYCSRICGAQSKRPHPGWAGPSPAPAAERFWKQVNQCGPIPIGRSDLGPCWVWTSFIARDGYGRFSQGRKRRGCLAHRWAWEHEVGRIPSGLELDHLCRNPSCVRPSHLEPVTHHENMARGKWAMQTHCKRGHAFTVENTWRRNTDSTRRCRTCTLEVNRRARQKRIPRPE